MKMNVILGMELKKANGIVNDNEHENGLEIEKMNVEMGMEMEVNGKAKRDP